MRNNLEINFLNKKNIKEKINIKHEDSSKLLSRAIEGLEKYRDNKARYKLCFRICDEYYINDKKFCILNDKSPINKSESLDFFLGYMKDICGHSKFETIGLGKYKIKNIVPVAKTDQSGYYELFNKIWDQLEIKEVVGPNVKDRSHRIFFYESFMGEDKLPVFNIILISPRHLSS